MMPRSGLDLAGSWVLETRSLSAKRPPIARKLGAGSWQLEAEAGSRRLVACGNITEHFSSVKRGVLTMSGHSKWHTIKHKKGAADAKRGKVFTRIIKELTVAARAGGGDPDMNPRLRTIVADAKSVNMPQDNIKRAIQRGTGELPGVNYEEITYEAYGPGGAAVIVETLTDNKNRTVGEIRHVLGKHGGNLAAENSVAWMFDKKGYIVVEKTKADEDTLMAAAIDAGADDLRDDGEAWEIVSAPDAFQKVLEAVKKLGIEPGAAEIAFLPQNYVKLEGKPAQQMIKLMEALEDHEDSKKVWSNADIEEKEIEASLA
jgi:YebC/PmpR family DNA-binding regulatory protein